MILTIHNIHTGIGCNNEELVALKKLLRSDNYNCLFSRKGRFYTYSGLLPRIKRRMNSLGFHVIVKDVRQKPRIRESFEWFPQLLSPGREYQVRAVEAALKWERGILWLPTGSGKTELALQIHKALGVKMLFLVHRNNLVLQTIGRYEKLTGRRAGRIGEGVFEDNPLFVAATLQTLYRKRKQLKDFFNSFDAVVLDEGHVGPSRTFATVMASIPAYYRYAISGTPLDRSDERNVLLVGLTGRIIYHLKAITLVAQGILAKPTIKYVTYRSKGVRGSYKNVYTEGIVRNTVRNDLIQHICKVTETPTLVFVMRIEHGYELQKRLEGMGFSVEFVWGKVGGWKREYLAKQLDKGTFEILIASTVFDMGVDIPGLRSIVIASSGKSVIASLQRLGRGHRTTEEKKEVTIWDFYDASHRWLVDHSIQRQNTYREEGYEVEEVNENDLKGVSNEEKSIM